jgi:hypothetical protein
MWSNVPLAVQPAIVALVAAHMPKNDGLEI